MVDGARRTFSADIVIVACGALSSALLFLRSANDAHPDGLANGSGLVGRNYMRHNNATVLAISRTPNPTQFQKTLGLNDFYHGAALSPANDWEFPLGHIQMVGKSDGAQVELEGLPALLHWLPQQPFDWIARHSIDFWLTTEDLPRPENRIYYRDGEPHLDVAETNHESAARLREKLRAICDKVDIHPHLLDRAALFRQGRADRRHRASGGDDAVRRGSADVGARSRLPRARGRQSLCRRRELLSRRSARSTRR